MLSLANYVKNDFLKTKKSERTRQRRGRIIVENVAAVAFLLPLLGLWVAFFLVVLIELLLEFFFASHASMKHVSDWGTIGLAFLSASTVIIVTIWERIRLCWQRIWRI